MIQTLKAVGKSLASNPWLKILSLLIAFLLWLVVVSIDNPVMTLPFTAIPITIENGDIMEENGKAFELADSSRVVSISVRAERSILSELSRDDFKASIDMTELDGNRVPIEVKATRYADRIQSVTPRQGYATVLVENLKKSQYKIQVETSGEVVDGYTVGSKSLTTNVVRVSGPESVVDRISKAVVRLNVSGMTSEIHSTEPIMLVDESGSPVDTSSLTLSVKDTNVTVDVWEVKTVAVTAAVSGTPAVGYSATGTVETSIKNIDITGESRDLAAVQSVSIPETAVDITGATGDVTVGVDISRYLPNGIYLVDSSQSEIAVTVKIEAAQSRTIAVPISNLTVENVPEGMNAAFQNPTGVFTVEVQGMSSVLNSLVAADITGTASLSGIGADGEVSPELYDADVTLSLPSGVTQDAVSVKVLLQNGEGTGAENTDSDESDSDGKKDSEEKNDDDSQTVDRD
ncbi:YbbR domain-containing protein [Lachnospiraceae bacterium]|nr:YbbR domain-containing protein [Lachnospiraceae bacterium]